MALDRLNYASGGERTDFFGMMLLLSYFSLKLNLYVEKNQIYFMLLRTLKEITIVTYLCFPVFLSTLLPACGKD